MKKSTRMGILPLFFFGNMLYVFCQSPLFLIKMYISWQDLHTFLFIIGVSDDCQHGDAIPVSQQITVCSRGDPLTSAATLKH